ncbi:MAG: hypothetical protein EHM36_00195 [Deltaproteobacteria bacterium]|nr:MAG: hypothetical protein EHM36_00195 [Deltaproteobacteria bacterium]
MERQLLIETMPAAFQILEDASQKNGGRMRVKCTYTVADEVNGNGRVYREHIVDREVEKLKALMAENKVFAEADHPEDGKSRISNTAAMLTKVEKRIEDNRKAYEGEAVILNTSKGKDLQEIIRAGGKIGVSSRGWGSIVKGNWNGKVADIVQEDFNLKTFDFVIGQSTKDAEVTTFTEQIEIVNLLEVGPCAGCQGICSETTNTKGGQEPMEIKTLEDLKKAYPELCEKLAAEAVSAREKEIRETMEKEFDARVLKEVEAKSEELKKAVIEEIRASDEFKGMASTLTEIAKLVAPYLPEGTTTEDDGTEELEQQVEELAGKVMVLETENKALKEQMDREKKEAEEKRQVARKIEEVTAGKKHGKLLVERLSSCKTVEEVEKRLIEEEAFIKKLIGEGDPPLPGKGKTLNENQTVETEADAERTRQRKLAGIP